MADNAVFSGESAVSDSAIAEFGTKIRLDYCPAYPGTAIKFVLLLPGIFFFLGSISAYIGYLKGSFDRDILFLAEIIMSLLGIFYLTF